MQQSVGALPGAAGPLTGTGPSQTESDRRGAVRKSENNQTCAEVTRFELLCCAGPTQTGSPMGEVVVTSWST